MRASSLSSPNVSIQANNAASSHRETLTSPIDIPAPGFVYIYVNCNSNTTNLVTFDNLEVTHLHAPFVAGGDYYPFGLPMADRQIDVEPYRWGYQGQFAEEDSVTGWNQFELRMYDARFGRWLSVDPYAQYASPYEGMGNDASNQFDKNGGLSGGGGGLWKWVANPTSVDNMAGYFKRTLLGSILDIAKEIGPELVNNVLQQDLSQRALEFTKDAIGNRARLVAERDFVVRYYDEPGVSDSYKRSFDRYGDASGSYDIYTPGNGYQYSGFGETGYTNVNQYLGDAEGPFKVKDPETGVTLGINRTFPRVDANLRHMRSAYVNGAGSTASNVLLEGEGFWFETDNPTLNAAAVGISFESRDVADGFYKHYYNKAYNAKIDYLKTYYKIHKP